MINIPSGTHFPGNSKPPENPPHSSESVMSEFEDLVKKGQSKAPLLDELGRSQDINVLALVKGAERYVFF